VDWGNVGIGSPLKADDNWARQTREKSICFLSERGYSLVDKVPVGKAFAAFFEKKARRPNLKVRREANRAFILPTINLS
jgi:hypothetical protein